MKLSLEQSLQLIIFLHAGTTLAAIIYFRRELIELIKQVPEQIKNKDSLLIFIIVSTIITGFIGYFLRQIVKKAQFINPSIMIALIGIILISTGILQAVSKNKKVRSVKKIKLSDSIIMGITQAFSAIPGVSRSGITTTTLLFRKFENHAALKLSFLCSIPVVIGAEIGMNVTEKINLPINTVLIATITSFIVGIISIRAFMAFAKRVNFSKFCIALGMLAVLFGAITLFI